MQFLCRAKKISMTSNVLPLHFAPSQASSSQNSNVDSYLQYCEVDSLNRSWSESSLGNAAETIQGNYSQKYGTLNPHLYAQNHRTCHTCTIDGHPNLYTRLFCNWSRISERMSCEQSAVFFLKVLHLYSPYNLENHNSMVMSVRKFKYHVYAYSNFLSYWSDLTVILF